jgi:hypothetical protein
MKPNVKGGVKVSQCGGVKGDHLWWLAEEVAGGDFGILGMAGA